MPDFTFHIYRELLLTLKESDYRLQTFENSLKNPITRSVILRHDVDARKMNSLLTARIEKELGIKGTYYFRIVPESFNEEVIREIAGMGHEIGYHYEDLSGCAARSLRYAAISKGLHDKEILENELAELAIKRFGINLQRLRELGPVETICMHGSPLSKWDNRLIWKYYDYRDYGIIGEPYFDIDFNKVLYLTDTGRRWDADSVNIRDKVSGIRRQASGKDAIITRNLEPKTQNPKSLKLNSELKFHSTFDIINAAKDKKLPDKIMMTVHPQRWNNQPFPWIQEFIWQNVKNIGKSVLPWRKSGQASEQNFKG